MKPNDDQTGCARGTYIHQLFEAQAEQTPAAIASVLAGRPLSYAELNARANQLAHHLKKRGVGRGSVVAVMDDRELETLVAILGVLKAGGSYLSIDHRSAADQVVSALDESDADVLLSRARFVENVPFAGLRGLHDVGQRVTVTSQRKQIADLDALPVPDRSLVDYHKYNQYIGAGNVKRGMSILATRGCPYHCSYCHRLWPKRHVVRSAQNIFEEILCHYDRGYNTFVFLDDIFNLDRRNSEALFELVIENNLRIRILFPNGLRGDILTPDYIDLMVEAGVMYLALALETASPRLQRLIHKNLDVERLRENLMYICQKHPNVILDLYAMVGFPTETEEEAWMTLDFIKGIEWLHFPSIFIVKIFPNTDLARLAMEHGVTKEAIDRSSRLAYHEPAGTTPFSKSFLRQYQAAFTRDYFLLPERLASVVPIQKQQFTREELVTRYNVYLPGGLENYAEIARLIGHEGFYSEAIAPVGEKGGQATPVSAERLRILLLDLSQHFSHEPDLLNSWVEAPLGLMCLLTYLNREFGDEIDGKIAKALVDFDSFEELKRLTADFRPQIVGLRTLSLYKDFFHRTVSQLRQWLPTVPIVAGGPYATSEYATLLADPNVDLVVLGEGELTFAELIGAMLARDGRLPADDVLEQIAGLAFLPRRNSGTVIQSRQVLLFEEIADEVAREPTGNLEAADRSASLACVIDLLREDAPGGRREIDRRGPPPPDATLEIELAYWKEWIGGNWPALPLPTNCPQSAVQSSRGKCQAVLLPKDLTQAVKTLSEREGCSLFATLLAAFKMLLYRYTLQEDILVGSPIAGDGRGRLGELVGLPVNVLALRTHLGDNPSFRELLSRVRQVALDAGNHQALPFGRLMRELQPEWGLGRNARLQVVFALQDAPLLALDLLGLSVSPLALAGRTMAFDLVLAMRDTDPGLAGTLLYNADCFDGTTIASMVDRFKALLEKVSANPAWRLLEIPLPGEEEGDLEEPSGLHTLSQSEQFDFTA